MQLSQKSKDQGDCQWVGIDVKSLERPAESDRGQESYTGGNNQDWEKPGQELRKLSKSGERSGTASGDYCLKRGRLKNKRGGGTTITRRASRKEIRLS